MAGHENHDHKLVLAFDSDSDEFVRGFEAGMVFADLGGTIAGGEWTVHTSNALMMMRMGETLGYEVMSKELDNNWMEIVFISKRGGIVAGE